MSPDHWIMTRFMGMLTPGRLLLLVLGTAIVVFACVKILSSHQPSVIKPVESNGQLGSATIVAPAETVNPFTSKSEVSEIFTPNSNIPTIPEPTLASQVTTKETGSESHSAEAEHVDREQVIAEEEKHLTERQLIESQEDYDAIQQELKLIAAEEEIMAARYGDVMAAEQDLTPEERNLIQAQEKEENYHL